MRKALLLGLALGLFLIFAGCDGTKELNDENYAEYYVKYYNANIGIGEEDTVRAEYGWTEEELLSFQFELIGDEERATNVYEMILEKDEKAAEEFHLWVWGLDLDDGFELDLDAPIETSEDIEW